MQKVVKFTADVSYLSVIIQMTNYSPHPNECGQCHANHFLALITYLEWAKLSSNSACMIDYLRRGCVHGHVTSLNFGKDCFLALTVSNSSLFTPALLRTHSFLFI